MILTNLSRTLHKPQQLSAGYWVLSAVSFCLISAFYPAAIILAAIFFWMASFKQRSKISPRNAKQSLVLIIIGLFLTCIAWLNNQPIAFIELMQGNVFIVSMLAGVSFLTVISQPQIGMDESLPTGKRSIISTFVGVHLFGAVINISSLFIHADRMSANRPLSPAQVVVLTRGFSTAALWSPFFAAMAVALSYAPSADLVLLMAVGGVISALGMGITFLELKRGLTDAKFYGYPLRISSLWLPSLLTLLVFVLHQLFPSLSILFIITACSPAVCILFLLKKPNTKAILNKHVENKLANMQNEIVLFLSAGIFAFGLKMLLSEQTFFGLFSVFDATAASLCFLLIVLLSIVGFHMLIGISIIAPIVLPLHPDPSLFAFVILAAWSMGAAVGPLSGMNISIQAMYAISSQKIMRWNLFYVCIMSAIIVAVIFSLNSWLVSG
jgi:hypothetical protein